MRDVDQMLAHVYDCAEIEISEGPTNHPGRQPLARDR
jgi:hypothetical protein